MLAPHLFILQQLLLVEALVGDDQITQLSETREIVKPEISNMKVDLAEIENAPNIQADLVSSAVDSNTVLSLFKNVFDFISDFDIDCGDTECYQELVHVQTCRNELQWDL